MLGVLAGAPPLEVATLDYDRAISLGAAIGQVAAALLSAVALAFSVWTFSRQVSLQRWQLRIARESHIIDWAQQCIDVMAETDTIIVTNPGPELDDLATARLVSLRTRLSAQIDHGRLYFPNIEHPEKGRDKDGAFQGSRQPILDHLVAYYDAVGRILKSPGMPITADTCAPLTRERRRFITEAQNAIDPRRLGRIVARH